jgi:tetratricopeptide repeat protein 25
MMADSSSLKLVASVVNNQVQMTDEKSAKQLLGELHIDKDYLAQFLEDPDFKNNPNQEVTRIVYEGLMYLESRMDFWRQQKPMYARRKDQKRTSSVSEKKQQQQQQQQVERRLSLK